MRWRGALLAAVVLLLAGRIEPACADISVIPLPAFGTSPNEGNTYGILPAVLFLDEEQAIRQMLAPSITYNEILGVNFTFRYFLFPRGGETLEVIAGASTRGSRDISVSYEDPRFGPAGRFYLAGEAGLERDLTFRFFGIGPDAPEENETNFTRRDTFLVLTGGINFARRWRLTLTERLRDVGILQGGVEELPFIADRFPDLPGVEGGFIHAQRLDLVFDTRDAPSLTTRGGYLGLGVELSSPAFGSDASYRRAILDTRLFLPVPRLEYRFLTVLRAAFEWVDGASVPFFEQATLGGENTLRGFGRNRFTDANSVVFNLEERIRLFTLRLFGTTSEWEAAPFFEVGKVYSRLRDFDFHDVAWSTGVGFRALVRPTVVGRVDIGIGPDGVATFVGLGFPF